MDFQNVDLAEKFDKMLQNFDFKRVHDAMIIFGWRWKIKDKEELELPSVEQMREVCCELFDDALNDYIKDNEENDYTVFSSCFEVTIYQNKDIELKFILSSAGYDSDLDEVY